MTAGTSDAMHPLISLEKISGRLGERLILTDTCWQIHQGQNWAIIGPNGSGKTLLTQILCRRRPIVAGSLTFKSDFSPAKDIALVSFESQKTLLQREGQKENSRHFSGSILDFTTVENILFDMYQPTEPEEYNFYLKIIGMTQISPLLHRNIIRLSTGEFRKVLISKALLKKPKLLILDEPLEGLDLKSRVQIRQIVDRLIKENVQIVMVTHRLDELPDGIDHIICLKNSKVEKIGRRKDILSPFVIEKLYGKDDSNFKIDPLQVGFSPERQEKILDNLIVMEQVCVRYKEHVVFKDLNWTVKQGENWRITGPNGSGKSTLLSLIAGDSPQAYSNKIYLFGQRRGSGESIWDIKKRIGLVSSEFQLRYQRNIKLFEVILSGFFDSVGLYRRATHKQSRLARKWLQLLNFNTRADHNFNQLSFGEQKLVLIARAMVKSPDLLILDEPCQGLDPYNRKKVLQFINKVGEIPQITLLFVTHHSEEKPACIDHELSLA